MLLNLFDEFRSLSASQAPQLVACLIVCGAISWIVPDSFLSVWAFSLTRLVVVILLWPTVGDSLGAASIIACAAAMLIFSVAVWSLRPRTWKSLWSASGKPVTFPGTAFRVLAPAVIALASYRIGQALAFAPAPFLSRYVVAWFTVSGVLTLLLTNTSLRNGWAALWLSDAARILYALGQPDPLLWGLWHGLDVFVVLVASYLSDREVAATRIREQA